MLYWIQILPPIGGATSMDFFATQIACLIATLRGDDEEGLGRIADFSVVWSAGFFKLL